MVKVIKNNDISEILEKDFAIADFNAVWCGPCRMLGPVLNEISTNAVTQLFTVSTPMITQILQRNTKYRVFPRLSRSKTARKSAERLDFVQRHSLARG